MLAFGRRPATVGERTSQVRAFKPAAKFVSAFNLGGSGVATGTVKWFNDAKGYGFIAPDEGGKDLFVHHTNIVSSGFRTLTDGSRVEYEAREGTKGPEAVNVAPIG